MNENPFPENPITSTVPSSVTSAANDLRSAAGDVAKSTSAQAAKVKDKTVETAQALKAIAVEKAGQYKGVATEKVEHYKSIATEKATQVKANTQQQYECTKIKAKEIHVTAEDYIRQNPTKAVLGALGVGFLIGLITRR